MRIAVATLSKSLLLFRRLLGEIIGPVEPERTFPRSSLSLFSNDVVATSPQDTRRCGMLESILHPERESTLLPFLPFLPFLHVLQHRRIVESLIASSMSMPPGETQRQFRARRRPWKAHAMTFEDDRLEVIAPDSAIAFGVFTAGKYRESGTLVSCR